MKFSGFFHAIAGIGLANVLFMDDHLIYAAISIASAATASLVLKFLPMLPGQILLNNLLYDSSQLFRSGWFVESLATQTLAIFAIRVLIDFAKQWFFAYLADRAPTTRQRGHAHRIHRRASRFSYPGPLNLRGQS